MYGYVYMTTNLINGRKYIGRHNCKRFDPSYLGSGKLIRQAVDKYGANNFEVKILEGYDTPEELYKGEADLINKYNAVESKEFYNLTQGGPGGG